MRQAAQIHDFGSASLRHGFSQGRPAPAFTPLLMLPLWRDVQARMRPAVTAHRELILQPRD
jgi:hypothetical protein